MNGHSNDISMAITSRLMKLSGVWTAANNHEQRRRNIVLAYTISGMLLLGRQSFADLYYSCSDFTECLYITANFFSLMLPSFKLLVVLVHKKDFFRLLRYMQQKFFRGTYDMQEKTILDACKGVCAFYICTFTCCAHATLLSYVVGPLIANIERNGTDRLLPFKMRVHIFNITPYFEIMFVLQSLALYQIGVCYMCFDNLLCIMNLHIACQFRILQYRLQNIPNIVIAKYGENSKSLTPDSADKHYATFKNYVKQHQSLIAFCIKLEKVFSVFALGQVLVFSSLICLDGYQVIMADVPFSTRMTFVFHILGCIAQLFMFTYSCDCIIEDSGNVATAMYATSWSYLPMDNDGRALRKDLVLAILYSGVPRCLTAHKFFPVSLETYTGIMSTAMSYFTLLKQRTSATT